ncbi:MAG: hypothetical protein ABWY54_08485, partial [Glaciihabitans sp.]
LPDDARHLVTVEFDDGALNLDLGQLLLLSPWPAYGPGPSLPALAKCLDVEISLPLVHLGAVI